MIDGEIYSVEGYPKCVFAYCKRGGFYTSYYIGVHSGGTIDISRSDRIYAMHGNRRAILANETQRERFRSILERSGYKWNKANKLIIKNGEIIKI